MSAASAFQFYLSPFEALQIEPEDDLDVKAIQRAKKLLLQELELNDGKVPWLGDYELDRSKALVLDDELLDPAKAQHHQYIFENKRLLRFLTHGDTQHFAYLDEYFPEDRPDLLDEDSDFLAFLSKPFAQQYDSVLTRAIDECHLPTIQALFEGRRLVLQEDEDLCFENTSRRVSALVEKVKALAEDGHARKPDLGTVERFLQENSLPELFNLLPPPFATQQDQAVAAIRGLAIDCWNEHDDAPLASNVLRLCQRFSCTVGLAKRLEDDFKYIEERVSEERLVKQLSVLMERMRAKADECRVRKCTLRELDAFLRQHLFFEVANALPPEAAAFQTALVAVLRGVAIDCFNEHDDATLARGVLNLCLRFNCPDEELTQKLQGDIAHLDELERAAMEHAATARAQQREQEKATAAGTVGCLVFVGIILLLSIISAVGSSTRTTAAQTYRRPEARPSIAFPALSPPTFAVSTALERDWQRIVSEKARAVKMEKELADLGEEIKRERLQLDRTSQTAVDDFNRRVRTYNELLEGLQSKERLINQLVDHYNEVLGRRP